MAEIELQRQQQQGQNPDAVASLPPAQSPNGQSASTSPVKQPIAGRGLAVSDVLLSWTTQATVALLSGIYPDSGEEDTEAPRSKLGSAATRRNGASSPTTAVGFAQRQPPGRQSQGRQPQDEEAAAPDSAVILPALDCQQQVQVRRMLVNQHLDRA